jgi:phage terminase large subunit-like protein
MTQAVEALEISVLDRKLVHDGNPVLTWNISNAMTISDPAGGRKLDKSKTRFRIDGAVALAMAIGLKSKDMKEVEGPSIYETRGILTFGRV